MSDLDLVHATARELFGRAVWTHKVHEVAREQYTKKSGHVNIWNIASAALTVALAAGSPLIPSPWNVILTGLSATATICLVIWQASSNTAAKEAQQRVAAKEVLCLREEFLLLIMNCQMTDADAGALKKHLESLTRELTRAYKFMPDTSPEANGITGKRLSGGEMTFSDEEINSYLPAALRKKISPSEDTGGEQTPK